MCSVNLHLFVLLFFASLSSASPQPSANPTGAILVRIRCPAELQDCHITKTCYSVFRACVSYGDVEECLPAPSSESSSSLCVQKGQKLVSLLEFNISEAVQSFSLIMRFTKKVILSQPKLFEVKFETPTLQTLPNATVPTDESWNELRSSDDDILMFAISAVVQCHKDRFGSLCKEQQTLIDMSTTPEISSTATATTPTPPTVISDDPDACSLLNCHNGGQCRNNKTSGPKCVCALGWRGELCEQRDACFAFACGNGGRCAERNGEALCTCKPGWIGAQCGVRDPCTSHPCKNGGTCTSDNDLGKYICLCPDHYIGSSCELVPQMSLANQPLIIILIVVAIAVPVVMGLIFMIVWICRQSKQNKASDPVEGRPRAIDDAILMRRQRSGSSGVYDKVDYENCYYTDNVSEDYEDPDLLIEQSRSLQAPQLPERTKPKETV